MYAIHIPPNHPANGIVRAAFPDYSGRRVSVMPTSGALAMASYWSDGNREYWALVRLADLRRMDIPENGSGYVPDVPPVELPAGFVAVCHHVCGRGNDYVTIHARPDDLTPLLPAKADLADDERTVLRCTRAYKSSYAGISNYRYHEARRETGITLERWEAAKAALIGRGLLNKAGAITVDGRNAIAR